MSKTVFTALVPRERHHDAVLLADWIASRAHQDLRERDVLGWAWATVDLAGALRESGTEREMWVPVQDQLLGARGVRLAGSQPALVLLEPSTEGRLAGWLARHGEGEAAIYRQGQSTPQPVRHAITALGGEGVLERRAEGAGGSTVADRRLAIVLVTDRR